MSQFDAAPPNTYAGGRDDNLRIKDGALPINASNDAEGDFDMVAYKRDTPLWKRIKDHSLTQMILLSIQAFCGLAMADAIAGLLGVGWLLLLLTISPDTVWVVGTVRNAVSYAALAGVCFLGGPLVNKLGTKWALLIGALTFPLRGASFYTNSKFGNHWFLIVGSFLEGFGTGAWYVAESGTIMSIAPSGARGKYLALWIVSRNLGQLIEAWPNHIDGVEGGVTPDTYIIFLIIECLAIPFALLISPLDHVVRSDGTRIRVSEKVETAQECRLIKKTWRSKLICYLLYGPSGHSSTGSWSTCLGLYFSVRARALSSLFSPFFCIVGCFGLGSILNMKSLSQRRRAQVGLITVVILDAAVYIWSIIMQLRSYRTSSSKPPGPLSQSYMYWLSSSFATDAQSNVRNGAAFRCMEAIGQAVAYGMKSKTDESPLIGFCVTFGLMALGLPPFIVLVNNTPDRIPADVMAEEEATEHKLEGGYEKKDDPVQVSVLG
ncbi:membrane protein [Kwoniella mangroviensis CBS 10435]|uniref:Membrane protein n=2 Tax=Kwoniella mangrovensis TaxID=463800 RepID=A0A1B9J2J6_9TREE|nr:membrane protein [Kwoniella mangroviensis CBS 10435]